MHPLFGEDFAWKLSLKQEASKEQLPWDNGLVPHDSTADVCLLQLESRVSDTIIFLATKSQGETLQSTDDLLVYAQLHLTIISPFLTGIWRNWLWGKEEKPPSSFLQFYFLSLDWRRFLFRKSPSLLEFWSDFPGIHLRLVSKCCDNGQLFVAEI